MSRAVDPKEEYADDFLGVPDDRTQRLRELARQSPKDRAASAAASVNAASSCARCGSTWFREAVFNQYKANLYSAAPGGDLEVISEMPMTIKICLCGFPAVPNVGGASLGGRTPNENLTSFNGSMKAALGYLTDAEGRLANVQSACTEVVEKAVAELNQSNAQAVEVADRKLHELEYMVTDLKGQVNVAVEKGARKKGPDA